ncbi:hypothetical protein H4R35_002470, partial [Dimargaris xerosporica]
MADSNHSSTSHSIPTAAPELALPSDSSSHLTSTSAALPVTSVTASTGVPTTLVGQGRQDPPSIAKISSTQDALAPTTAETSVLPLSASLAIDWSHMAAMGWSTSTELPPGVVPSALTTEPADTWGQSFWSAFGYPVPTLATPTADLEHLHLMDTTESHDVGSASAPTLPLAMDVAVSENDTEAGPVNLAALWQASASSWPHPALAEWSTAASMDELTSGWYMGHLPGLAASQFDTASMLPLTLSSATDNGLAMGDGLSAWATLPDQVSASTGQLGQAYPPTIALPVLSHASEAQPSGSNPITPAATQTLPEVRASVSTSESMDIALQATTHTVAPRRRRRGKRSAAQAQPPSADANNNRTQSSPVIPQLHSSPFDSALQSTFGSTLVSASSAPLTPAGPYFDPAVLAAAFGSHPSASTSAGLGSCGQQFLHHTASYPGYVSSPATGATVGPSASSSSSSPSLATSTTRSSCSSTAN